MCTRELESQQARAVESMEKSHIVAEVHKELGHSLLVSGEAERADQHFSECIRCLEAGKGFTD